MHGVCRTPYPTQICGIDTESGAVETFRRINRVESISVASWNCSRGVLKEARHPVERSYFRYPQGARLLIDS